MLSLINDMHGLQTLPKQRKRRAQDYGSRYRGANKRNSWIEHIALRKWGATRGPLTAERRVERPWSEEIGLDEF